MSASKQLIRSRLTNDQLRQVKKVYHPAYEGHFGPLRRRPLGLFEIGIGGYETAEAGGGSLRCGNAISHMPGGVS
jgi:hypothetical protein